MTIRLDSLELPRTYRKAINTDAPAPGDEITEAYQPDRPGDLMVFDVLRRVPVRYVLVTVEDAGDDAMLRLIGRIEDQADVLEVDEVRE